MIRLTYRLTLALIATLCTTGAPALAGNGPNGYPERPVTLIVPFAPGGGSDNIARYVASRLHERTNATIIVENRAGAGTNIGNTLAAQAQPDGYTLLFAQVTLAINPHIYKDLRYDVQKDFTPVAHLASSPTVLLTSQHTGVQSVADLIAYAKRNPGAVNYGSGGAGTSVHLAGHLFDSIAQMGMTHIPYKGSGPAMVDLIGGQIQAIFDTAPSAVPQARGGKVVPLAVTGPNRLAALPDVPTFAEVGYAAFDAPAWYGLMAPRGTPEAIVHYLNQQINLILAEPDTQARFTQLGSVTVPGTPEDFGAFIAQESARWAAVAKSANVRTN